MRIYAVLDLKDGQVVHAIAGQREHYEPVRSALTSSSNPSDVARAINAHWSINEAYVADLDAIGGRQPDIESIRSIAETGMRLILDIGIGTSEQVDWLEHHAQTVPLQGIIVPLESCHDTNRWPELVRRIGPKRAIFSLDLCAGQPNTRNVELRRQTPVEIADRAWHAGFRRIIVLDLRQVGTGQGPSTVALCHTLSQQHAWTELISGGGVRGTSDLERLERAGCDAALVASMLHGP